MQGDPMHEGAYSKEKHNIYQVGGECYFINTLSKIWLQALSWPFNNDLIQIMYLNNGWLMNSLNDQWVAKVFGKDSLTWLLTHLGMIYQTCLEACTILERT